MAQTKAKSANKSSSRGVAADRLVPLHHQVYMMLRRRLLEGVYPADKPLPGEHRLAEEFEVSRVTIRRTLARLGNEGLVTRRRGSGTFPGEAVRHAGLAVPLGTLREHLERTDAERRRLELVSFESLLS